MNRNVYILQQNVASEIESRSFAVIVYFFKEVRNKAGQRLKTMSRFVVILKRKVTMSLLSLGFHCFSTTVRKSHCTVVAASDQYEGSVVVPVAETRRKSSFHGER